MGGEVSHWITRIVEQIHAEYPTVLRECNDQTPLPWLTAVIYAHLPKCETCKHWELTMPDKEKGNCHVYCNAVNFDMLLTHKDFGCVAWEAK
jgi:hypothetical protein